MYTSFSTESWVLEERKEGREKKRSHEKRKTAVTSDIHQMVL